MKRRVLVKTAPFHAFHCQKKKREANGAVLNGTISLLLPLDTQRTGEEEAFSLPFFILYLSPKTQKKPTPRLVPSLTPPRPHAKRAIPCRVQRQGRLCSSRPPMLPPCPAMRRQGRVALTPSAYKYRGSAGQKEEEKRRKERESWKYFCFEERGGKPRERNRLGRERDDRN